MLVGHGEGLRSDVVEAFDLEVLFDRHRNLAVGKFFAVEDRHVFVSQLLGAVPEFLWRYVFGKGDGRCDFGFSCI